MKSFKTLYNELSTITGEDSTAAVAKFKSDIVATNGLVLTNQQWPFLEKVMTLTTVAAQNNYKIPNSMQRITSVTCTVGSVQYRPKPVESVKMWEYLQSLRIATSSNITQFYFRQGNQVLLWPTPQSAFTVNIRGRKATRSLSLDDYTTGTITSIANAATTVTGNGTSWATGGVGNHIRIDYTTGDFMWYEISSITSTTALELLNPYEGVSVAAATETYTIGEFSDIPSDFHDILLFRPLALHYSMLENTVMAKQYWLQYDGGFEAGFSREYGGLMKQLLNRHSENFEGVYMDEAQPKDPSTADLLIKNFGYSGEGW